MVLDVGADRVVTAMNRTSGVMRFSAGAVILAMGCRERPRGALGIPGYRPAGIFTAGTAQRLVNMEGYLPGREVVILGSGDIGLIMARRMTLEGAHVKLVAEIMPFSGGLRRNIVQCLDDYGIPLLLSHTVVDVEGRERVSAVTIAQVDERLRPIPGTEKRYECDTLLLSCGLIPENELSSAAGVELSNVTRGPIVNESLETSIPGIFACGNVLHVHDLVDYVSEESAMAGRCAAAFVEASREGAARASDSADDSGIPLVARDGVRYTVPSTIRPSHMPEALTVRFRVGEVRRGCSVCVYIDGERMIRKKRPVVAPGEMEEVRLKRSLLESRPLAQEIVICLEDE
jgi:thioredoxin reductase